jgi:oligopeptidase B
MNLDLNVLFILSLAALLAGCTSYTASEQASANNPEPPKAALHPEKLSMHGHERTDNYYWLNDRENPEVIAYLNAENEYTAQVMAHTTKLQEELYKELKGRIKEKDESVPYKRYNHFYSVRFDEGSEYPIYGRRQHPDQQETTIIDANELAKGHEYFHLSGGHNTSPNEQLLAYAIDTVSRRLYTLQFKNLATGEVYPERIQNTSGRAVWANDNKTVFYVKKDVQTLRDNQVYRHVLGTDPATDQLLFEEKDETFSLGIDKSKSDQYILVHSGSTLTSEVRVLNANQPQGNFQLMLPREREHLYDVDHINNRFYIRTNWQAKNFRLMETAENNLGNKTQWKEVVPHRPQVLLEDLELFNNFLVLQERENGLTQVRIIRWNDRQEHLLNFGEAAYTAHISENHEADTPILRYEYTSLTTPNSTFDYNMETRTSTLLKQQEVIGNFDPKNYRTERVFAKAADGTAIPMSIVYHKDFKKNGTHPGLIYGYGSYGISMEPTFSSYRLSLLDRGFVYAIAHIRGGEEMGRQWYEDGKMFKKKNTFTDFIACSEYLVKEKYVAQDGLFAKGGSAGGLLMGAVVNMRPDLYKGIIAGVPFVDVITTMLDESIPLTTGEYDEWGNPNNKESYEYMLSYSPYDNVEAKDYPHMLITTGLHDSQVQYWEPAKWVARLRTLKTDQNRLLLKTNMDAGHGGASGRFNYLKEVALDYAFMLDLAGRASAKDPA